VEVTSFGFNSRPRCVAFIAGNRRNFYSSCRSYKIDGGRIGGHTHTVSVNVNHRAALPSCKRMSLQKNVAWHECAQNGK